MFYQAQIVPKIFQLWPHLDYLDDRIGAFGQFHIMFLELLVSLLPLVTRLAAFPFVLFSLRFWERLFRNFVVLVCCVIADDVT